MRKDRVAMKKAIESVVDVSGVKAGVTIESIVRLPDADAILTRMDTLSMAKLHRGGSLIADRIEFHKAASTPRKQRRRRTNVLSKKRHRRGWCSLWG